MSVTCFKKHFCINNIQVFKQISLISGLPHFQGNQGIQETQGILNYRKTNGNSRDFQTIETLS